MTAPSRRQKTVIKIDEIQRIKHKYLSSLNKICNANINIRFKNSSELPEFSPLRAECDGEGGVKRIARNQWNRRTPTFCCTINLPHKYGVKAELEYPTNQPSTQRQETCKDAPKTHVETWTWSIRYVGQRAAGDYPSPLLLHINVLMLFLLVL